MSVAGAEGLPCENLAFSPLSSLSALSPTTALSVSVLGSLPVPAVRLATLPCSAEKIISKADL